MGATASKNDAPFETLDADQVRDVVAGFGAQFAGAADKMREAGIDGDYLAHASDDDLAVVFAECGLTNKLQQSLLKQKLRKATATRAPVAPPPLPPRPISPPPPKDEAPTPPAVAPPAPPDPRPLPSVAAHAVRRQTRNKLFGSTRALPASVMCLESLHVCTF